MPGPKDGWRRAVSWRDSLYTRALVIMFLGCTVLVGGIYYQFTHVIDAFVHRLLHDRTDLAQTTAHHLEQLLLHDLNAVQRAIGPYFDPESDDALDALATQLGTERYGAVFNGEIFVLDAGGHPPSDAPGDAARAMDPAVLQATVALAAERQTVVVRPLNANGATRLLLLTPMITAEGTRLGYFGVIIDVASIALQALLGEVYPGEDGALDLIGPEGRVLTSTVPGSVAHEGDHDQILVRAIRARTTVQARCHRCHDAPSKPRSVHVMAFAPMPRLELGIAVRQPEASALAPAFAMRGELLRWILSLTTIFLGFTFFFVRGVVGPVRRLARAVEDVEGGGDVALESQALPKFGGDEVGMLAAAMSRWQARLTQSISTIVKQQHELMRHEQRRELLQEVLSAQEEERRRIARELHDTVSQDLAAMRLRLERLGGNSGGMPCCSEVNTLEARAAEMIETVRRMTVDLRPLVLEKMGGLVPAVQYYLQRVETESSLRTSLSVEGEDNRLSQEQVVTLFRIFQESLSNVVQHAEAEHLIVSLVFEAQTVTMCLEDDGKGFDTSEHRSPKRGMPAGLGLLGMEERAHLLGGTMTIDSEHQQGTTVFVEVPTGPGPKHIKE